MDDIINLQSEKALNNFWLLKQKLKQYQLQNPLLFSGIKAIDDLVQGFDLDKKYAIIASHGAAAETFVTTILRNFNLIYDTDFTETTSLSTFEVFETGHRLHNNAGRMFTVCYLPDYINYRENHEKRPELIDVLKHFSLKNIDIVLGLYRPEYFNIETWEDGSSTNGQIEISVLKNETDTLGSAKLFLNLDDKIIASKKNGSFLQSYSEKIKKILGDDCNSNTELKQTI